MLTAKEPSMNRIRINISQRCWLICLSVTTLVASSSMLFSPAFAQTSSTPATPISGESTIPPDKVYLKSGGELVGKILSETKEDGREYVTIRTETGAEMKLDAGRLIRKIAKADAIDLEYQRRLKIAGDDPTLLWRVYEWCQEQPSGKSRFKSELKFLLERIAKLDPNDELSRHKLGFDNVDGQWIHKPSLYAAHGYIRSGTTWVADLQLDLNERIGQSEQIENDRKKQFSKWLSASRNPSASREELIHQLFELCDAAAVPVILDQQAKTEKNPKIRLLYVEAFGRVPSPAAQRALCFFAIEDPEIDIRDRALTLLAQPHYNPEVAARMMAGYLSASDPVKMERTAFAIGELGAISTMIELIESLETKQTITIGGGSPGQMNTTFDNAGGIGFQAGNAPQTIERIYKNDKARLALKKISNQDLGFNEEAWKVWYLKNYTLHDERVRADD